MSYLAIKRHEKSSILHSILVRERTQSEKAFQIYGILEKAKLRHGRLPGFGEGRKNV